MLVFAQMTVHPEPSVLAGATPTAFSSDPVTRAMARRIDAESDRLRALTREDCNDRRVRRLLVLSVSIVALVVAVLLAAGLVYPAAAMRGLDLVGGAALRLSPGPTHGHV